MSPTTVFPAAAKCMSSNGGALWDWPLFTPDIHARQLFLTLPFYMPTTTPPLYTDNGLHYSLIPFFLRTCAVTKSNNSCFFLCCRRSSVLPARVGETFSPRDVLSPSVFITFCLLCCIPGKEVKIAFALQVLYVGCFTNGTTSRYYFAN